MDGLRVVLLFAAAAFAQDLYPDYAAEADVAEPYAAVEDNFILSAPATYWPGSGSQLSPPFVDTTLTGTCSNSSQIVCTGCRRVRVCIPGVTDPRLLPEQNCPPSTYCHTLAFDMGGACLATIDPLFPECRNTADVGGIGTGDGAGILCTGLGVFPDPSDCHKFHYCTQVGVNSRAFRCPHNYVYDSAKRTCSRSRTCRTVHCHPFAHSIFVPFPQNSRYYAYCNFNRDTNPPVLRNILMYQCEAHSEFSQLAKGCVYKCNREGFFEKIGDPSRFYWCRRVLGRLLGYEQVCPGQGSVFNARLGICVPAATTTTPASSTTTDSTGTDSTTTDSTTTDLTTTEASQPAADTPVRLPAWPQLTPLSISQLLSG